MQGVDAIQVVSGIAAVVAVLLIVFAKPLSVNLPRRIRGAPPLTWRDIRRSDRSWSVLRRIDDETLAADRQLYRQKAWEKHLYFQDIASAGYAGRRPWCEEHQRHCYTANPIHAPGGDNPPVQDDFDPDGAPMEGVPKRRSRRGSR